MPTKAETKPFLSFNDQIQLLKSRGLVIDDENFALDIIQRINYYRLSAYSLTLRKDDIFYPNTTIEQIVQLYKFDSDLRNLVLKYTSYIESAFRTYISYHHSENYGPLGYLNNNWFEDEKFHAGFLSKLFRLINSSNDIFILHHKNEKEGIYPFWVAIEVTTFDVLSKLYKNLLTDDRTLISKKYYGVHREYVENWIQCAVIARNVSAHGGRWYNRVMKSSKVKLSEDIKNLFDASKPFAFIFAIYKLQPANDMRKNMILDIQSILKKYPFVQERYLGFPEEWKTLLEEQTTL